MQVHEATAPLLIAAHAKAVLQHMALQQHGATRDAMSLHSPEDLVHLRLNDMLPSIEVHHDSQHILDSLQECLQSHNTCSRAPLRITMG